MQTRKRKKISEAVIFNFKERGANFLQDLEDYFSTSKSISLDDLAEMGSKHGIEVVDYDTFYEELPELWRKGEIPPRNASIFGLANPNTKRARIVLGLRNIGSEMIPMIRTIVSHELVHVGQSERMAPGQIYIPPRTVFDKKIYYSDFREIMAWSRTIADEIMQTYKPESFERAMGLLNKSNYFKQIRKAVSEDKRVWNKYIKNIYNYLKMEFEKEQNDRKESRNLNEIRMVIRQMISEIAETMPNISTGDSLKNLRNYVQDNIEFEGYDQYEGTPKSRNIDTAKEVFMDEYGWAVEQMGQKKAFMEWLQGLPSIIDIPFYYNDMRNLMYALGYDEVKEMDDSELSEFYYDQLYQAFFE